MAEEKISYGLTTKERIKDRIGLTTSNFDTLLDRLIAAATDIIESECGGRRFKETTYTNEVYSIYNSQQKMVALKNIPIGTVTGVQYRAGLKSNPNWTDFNTDDWEVVTDGKSGLIKIWGIPHDINQLRVSYTAGFTIDFSNAGTSSHTLPADLSDMAERLTIKLFKKRENEGKLSETFEGTTVQWKELFDEIDNNTLARYRRLPEFI